MAIIDVKDTIRFPIDQVYPVYRNKLPELSVHLVNIDTITCESREEDGDLLYLVNRWKAAKTEVPLVARPFVKPTMLEWLDKATWFDAEHRVEWVTEMMFMTEAVEVHGENFFRADGQHTVLHLTGTITVDPTKVPGAPKLLAKRIKAPVEAFIVKMMKPNLLAINRGIESFLEAGSQR